MELLLGSTFHGSAFKKQMSLELSFAERPDIYIGRKITDPYLTANDLRMNIPKILSNVDMFRSASHIFSF